MTPTVWVLPSTVEFIHQKLSKAVNRHPPPFICIWTLRLQFLQHLLHLQIYLKKEISASTCPLFGKNFYIARCNEKQKKFNLCCTKLFNSWEIFLFARRSCFWGVSCYCEVLLPYKKPDFYLAKSPDFIYTMYVTREIERHKERYKCNIFMAEQIGENLSLQSQCTNTVNIGADLLSAKSWFVIMPSWKGRQVLASLSLTLLRMDINYQRSIGNNPLQQKHNFWLILQSLISLSDFLLSLSGAC